MCGPAGILHAVNFHSSCRVEVFVLEAAKDTMQEAGRKEGVYIGEKVWKYLAL